MLRIQLLGEFGLVRGDKRVSAVATPRERSLLVFLLIHRHVPQSREHLAFILWPDSAEGQARTNLRKVLHALRQSLPEADDYLSADFTTLQWRPDAPYSLDVADFEQACAEDALQAAVDLYRGDLLPGCYDDWIQPERERLQGMFTAVAERLGRQLEERRDYGAALAITQRLLRHDPLREESHRALIRLHALNDDRAAALRAYHACATLLQRELDVAPDRATRQLYERLVQPEPAGGELAGVPPPLAVPLALVGRVPEWARQLEVWHTAAGGKPQLLLWSGDAGIGKTRLAEELLAWTGRQGLTAAAARCYAAEGALAYAPVVAWLRSPTLRKRLATLDGVRLTEVARLLPELLNDQPRLPRPGPLTESWQRQRMFEALARGVLRADEPLLLLVDDLQWCDQDTLEWLRYLLRFDPVARLLIVGTVRAEDLRDEHPVTALVSTLRRDGLVVELALGPLNAEETAALAAHMAEQALAPEQQARLHRETEGNPLFVVEMMRSGRDLKDAQPALPDGHPAGQPSMVNPRALPPKVHAVLHTRLAQLSPDARALAGLAATIGREFTFCVLAGASDQTEPALVRGLDELWQRRIIREQGTDAYDFTHDKLREVAYTSLSTARRRLLHGRVAQALEAMCQGGEDPVCSEVANHYELAGRFGQAIPHYQRAAESAHRLYANHDAIRYYRRALALLEGPASPPRALAVDLYERLGDILHFTGQYDEARDSLLRAAALVAEGEWIGRAQVQRKIGNAWREQYRYAEALQLYSESERILNQAPIEKSTAWWQAWIQTSLEKNLVYYWQGHVSESDALRRELQPAIEQHGAPGQRAVYFQEMAWIEFRRNRSVATEDSVALATLALVAQEAAGNQAGMPAAHFGVGFLRLWGGSPQAALAPLTTALRLAEETGDLSLQARCLTYLTVICRQCGQVETTRQYAGRSLEAATAAHMPEYVGIARANQAWLAWLQGDLAQTLELSHTALALWQQLPAGHASAPFQWLALWPLIAVALHMAQPSRAIDAAAMLLAPTLQRLPDALAANLEQAIQSWTAGAPEAACALLDRALDQAQQMHYL